MSVKKSRSGSGLKITESAEGFHPAIYLSIANAPEEFGNLFVRASCRSLTLSRIHRLVFAIWAISLRASLQAGQEPSVMSTLHCKKKQTAILGEHPFHFRCGWPWVPIVKIPGAPRRSLAPSYFSPSPTVMTTTCCSSAGPSQLCNARTISQ